MVVLQAGHVNIAQNCSADMRSGTGAPQEAIWTASIAELTKELLATVGVAARVVDANFNCAADVGDPYECVVAIHYQANLPTASGFYVGTMNPAEDGNPAASSKLRLALTSEYAVASQLREQAGWNNVNITEYYLWKFINGQTPVALIECGVGAIGAPDHAYLWSIEGERAAVRGIANGILRYLGKEIIPLLGPTPQPTPTPTPTDRLAKDEADIAAIKLALDRVGHTLEGV